MRPSYSWMILFPWAVTGCGGPGPQPEATEAKDSLGIRIVESRRGIWVTPWRVEDRPLLTIGSIEGDPDQELDQVTGAVGLADERILVANGGRLELLLYDRSGRLLRRIGGPGEGPGEFQSLEGLARYGPDSVMAVDVRAHRVSFYDASGTFGRSVQLAANSDIPSPFPVGFFADGSFLATQGSYRLGGAPPVRVERTLQPLFRFDPDGRTATHLGSFPGPEWVIAPVGPVGASGRRLERRRRPFGLETVYAAADDEFYVGDNETYELRVYASDGTPRRVIRKLTSPLRLDQADIRSFEDSALAAASDLSRDQLRALFDNLPPPPETYPAYAPEIHVDGERNVWVRESSRPGSSHAAWSVFSAEGALLGSLAMPAGLHVMEIGGDYVLGVERDEMGVEYVKKVRLHRGS